jgi:succinate dehydrogenase/fumarate reductase flavoprotein subunit
VRLDAAREAIELVGTSGPKDAPNTAEMLLRLQAVMSDDVGPLRTKDGLLRALAAIDAMTRDIGERPLGDGGAFDMVRLDWFDLRNMMLVAHTVAKAALARTESRGAHQREDYPGMLPEWRVNQVVRLAGRTVSLTSVPAAPVEVAAQ